MEPKIIPEIFLTVWRNEKKLYLIFSRADG